MGRSAKVHKRVKKSASNVAPSSSNGNTSSDRAQAAKKKIATKLKAKSKAATSNQSNDGEHVLGGADYVSVMMGGRRRAKEEAKKMPVSMDEEND
jgi:hypothetical protein